VEKSKDKLAGSAWLQSEGRGLHCAEKAGAREVVRAYLYFPELDFVWLSFKINPVYKICYGDELVQNTQ
jgi:hypothetical protein